MSTERAGLASSTRGRAPDTMSTAGGLGRYLLDKGVNRLIIDTAGLGSDVYCVAFGGLWDSGYIREEDLEAAGGLE